MKIKEHLFKIILGFVLVILVIWFFRPVPRPGPDPAEAADRALVERALMALQSPKPDLDGLGGQAGDYDGGGRNLFDYGVIKPPPPSAEELARRAAEEEERRRKAEEDRLAKEAERERLRAEARAKQEALERQRRDAASRTSAPRSPAKPTPPPIPFKFVGVLGPSNAKIVIFADEGEFLLAKEGEPVKEQFRIMKISHETLQMGFTDPQFAEESRILTMGQ
jgi:hypothetical protein